MNIHKEYLKNKKERKKLVLILVLMITLFWFFMRIIFNKKDLRVR